ncbi:hypothetical protein [Methylorubrum aminovorans]
MMWTETCPAVLAAFSLASVRISVFVRSAAFHPAKPVKPMRVRLTADPAITMSLLDRRRYIIFGSIEYAPGAKLALYICLPKLSLCKNSLIQVNIKLHRVLSFEQKMSLLDKKAVSGAPFADARHAIDRREPPAIQERISGIGEAGDRDQGRNGLKTGCPVSG